ncbi:AMP-binding protein [Legionella geestiana]|uniref:AMP-binding protein n=1 Tax=Legionella geestiana TaxID=45065 RepID=UPI001091D57F|nr:AMP-binding protein [Legionella geestiana]QDQ39065.1 AMP-binding protein [Legionella geestiana]
MESQDRQRESEAAILFITRQFLKEQEMSRALSAVSLDASLDNDLGIDSLGKVELFTRIEKNLDIRFPDAVMAQSDTLRAIAEAAAIAKPDLPSEAVKSVLLQETTLQLLSPDTLETMVDVLYHHAEQEPDRVHMYLVEEGGQELPLTFGELLDAAKRVATGLKKLGVGNDDAVAIMLPTGFEFFKTFMGILLAGAIPVPLYPPFRPDRLLEYAMRESRILANAEARCLVTFAGASMLGKLLKSSVPSLRAVVLASSLGNDEPIASRTVRRPEDAVIVQYTSGSTGDPKGVLITHQSMLSNIRSSGKAMGVSARDSLVSWLPLYHDMGLMSWLGSLYFGIPITIFSPLSFLNRPERWLWAIHYHRGTISAGPNFAYALCVKKIDPKAIEGLDLSSWRLALNGAEAVNSQTLLRFYETFKKYGLQKSALYPVYGLAENTVGLSFPVPGSELIIDRVKRERLETEGYAEPAGSGDAVEFVSLGRTIEDSEIRIVDAASQPVRERQIGEIQFRGASAMQGYYRNLKATAAAWHDGWWDTGDLGYIANGDLYITGRKKDLIIKAGRNLYPETIEDVTGKIPGIRRGCVVAFGVSNAHSGTEHLVIVAETADKSQEGLHALEGKITHEVSLALGVPPDKVVLVPPQSIPKTSSGKLQRSACKQAYLKGDLGDKHASMSLQAAKLVARSLYQRVRGWPRFLMRVLYTLYSVLIIAIPGLLSAAPALLMPEKLAARWLKVCARGLCMLLLVPVRVKNLSDKPIEGACIYCPNHASYMDALVLQAVLPAGTRFVGKKELMKSPGISLFLKKLRMLSVDRFEFSKNLEDTAVIGEALAAGDSVTLFPEGTFTFASGLRPFRSGAFQLAVDSNVPIVPVSLTNTRKWLRTGSYLFSPASVTVTIGEPLQPVGSGWEEVVRLRKATRMAIAAYCGEDVLDLVHSGPER